MLTLIILFLSSDKKSQKEEWIAQDAKAGIIILFWCTSRYFFPWVDFRYVFFSFSVSESLKKKRPRLLNKNFSLFLKVEDRMALFSLEAINEDLPAVPWFLEGIFKVGPLLSPPIISIWGFPQMVGFPNKPMGFPTEKWWFWDVKWGYHHLRKHPYRGPELHIPRGEISPQENQFVSPIYKGYHNPIL